jgi:hypothetical protein
MSFDLRSITAGQAGARDLSVCGCQAVARQIDSELHRCAVVWTERRATLGRATNSVGRNAALLSIGQAGREKDRPNRSVVSRVCVQTDEGCALVHGALENQRGCEPMPLRVVETVYRIGERRIEPNRL